MKPNLNPARILVKALILYFSFEIFLVLSNFNPSALNVYGLSPLMRERFPFITSSKAEDRALDVGILDTVFTSHIISVPKQENEYRVVILGDSSIWGDPLPVESTLAAQINHLKLTCGNRQIVAYNLGYPLPSAIKDIMVLKTAMEYEPDLVIWGVTLYTLTTRMVEEHPLLETEPGLLASLNSQYHFMKSVPGSDSFYQDALAANFRISRTLRYQSYSLVQLATGKDQVQVETSSAGAVLSGNIEYAGMAPPTLPKKEISINLVNIFEQVAASAPVLIFNEPMLVAQGEPNSDLKYNAYYPRWAYDQYRDYMNEAASQYGWMYLDLWDDFSPEFFANSPLHLNREGEKLLANALSSPILQECLK